MHCPVVLLGFCLEPKARILFLRMSDAELSQGLADSIRVLHSATRLSVFGLWDTLVAKQQHNTHSDVIIVIHNSYNLLIFSASLLSLGAAGGGRVLLKYSLKVNMLVAQLWPTLCDPMDCSPPGSSVHGILHARILEWVAISFSRWSSQPRDRTWVSCTAGRFTI